MTPVPARRSSGAKKCKRCDDAPVRHVKVYVGPPPGRGVNLCIDENPHPDGRVVKLRDGRWRLLGLGQTAAKDAYRIHGTRSCGDTDVGPDPGPVGEYGRRVE